ncbi:type III secretion system gatekeeper subunit SctW [Cedecea davisae]|uniref:type III secretion system gatekeeper subunit SctW n=1 Tax=Cedecea davisae TaxID=158484 RepID=UPI0024306D77|nr:type III secretion system gatekeeper subunit SctW [Cedecea davisae]
MQRRETLSTNKELSASQADRQDALAEGEPQVVEDESPAALLQRFSNATDEMSAAMAQFRSRRDYEKKSGAAGDTSFDQVLDEEVQPKFDKLVKILKGAEGSNIETLLRNARSLFPDESDLVLVLRETLRRRDLDELVRKRLKKLLSQVEKEADPKRLKAGINVALKARLFGKTLMMSPSLMRESYRGFLASDEHEIELYQDWISTYGVEKRGIVINFMEDAVLADIDSVDPSCSHVEFGYLLGRIGQVKLIRSCEALFMQSVLSDDFVREVNHDEGAWLFFMFGVLQSPHELGNHLTQVTGEYLRFVKKTERAKLLQIIYVNCKKIPHEAFTSFDAREELLDQFKTLADKALQNENRERRHEGS